jgi:hypothetical protein
MSENFQHPKENNKNLQPPREKTKIFNLFKNNNMNLQPSK